MTGLLLLLVVGLVVAWLLGVVCEEEQMWGRTNGNLKGVCGGEARPLLWGVCGCVGKGRHESLGAH